MKFKVKIIYRLLFVSMAALICYGNIGSAYELFHTAGIKISMYYYVKNIMLSFLSVIFFIFVLEVINFNFETSETEIIATFGLLFKFKAVYNSENILALYHNQIILKNSNKVPIIFQIMQNSHKLYYCFYNLLKDKTRIDDKVKIFVEKHENEQKAKHVKAD